MQHADDSTFPLEDQLLLKNALNIITNFGKKIKDCIAHQTHWIHGDVENLLSSIINIKL